MVANIQKKEQKHPVRDKFFGSSDISSDAAFM